MENKKIITTDRELSMAIAYASLLACEEEEYKHIKDKDIMSITAFVSAAVQKHLAGEQKFDPESYELTKRMFEVAESLHFGAASIMIIRKP